MSDHESAFIGQRELLEKFYKQLKDFELWNEQKDWLAFHNHHYDWWAFPIDEISSRNYEFTLTKEAIENLRRNEDFIKSLRRAVELVAKSWGWNIKEKKFDSKLDKNQKWSYWPVRLYKAGRSLWIFGQTDYYDSLKILANIIKFELRERLDFFSQTTKSKADVLERWSLLERS